MRVRVLPVPVPSHGHAVRDAGWPPAGSEDSEPGSPLGCTAVQPVPGWRQSIGTTPSARTLRWLVVPLLARPDRKRARAGMSAERSTMSSVQRKSTPSDLRGGGVSRVRVQSPWAVSAPVSVPDPAPETRTDHHGYAPGAARCPPPPSPIAPSFGVLSREPKRCERGRVGGS